MKIQAQEFFSMLAKLNCRLTGKSMIHAMRGSSLRAKALRGFGWTTAGFGAQQVLRLGSNMILTRLLFPEAFGLMALAQVFLLGVNMLSDIGVGPSIVQSKRGDDTDFLSTAWTIQVIRGFILFIGMCMLAYPVSLVYDQELLFPILIFIGSTAVISGFQSIGVATANRKVFLGYLTVIEVISQAVGIVATILWAWMYPSVWSLVGGGVIASFVNILLGHTLLGSAGNCFHFERTAASEILHFGKWIFVGTALTYFGGHGLRLIEGKLVPLDLLGMLHIVGMLSWAAEAFVQKFGGSVLFPAFAEIHRDRPECLLPRIREARLKLFLMTLPVFVILILFGRELIAFMYDERYMQAGEFLVIVSTGRAISAQRSMFGMVMISVGDSFGHAMIMTIFSIARISAVIMGFHYGGVVGMLAAVAATVIIIYPFEVWRLRRVGLWLPGFDMVIFSFYALLGVFSFVFGPIIT